MYSLTKTQIKHFYEKGWLGPLDTFSLAKIQPIKDYLAQNSQEVTIDGQQLRKFYNHFLGYQTTREHHLCCPSLLKILKDGRIVRRLNQLGESNLLLWRSNIFDKLPGQEGIGWHQAINYDGQKITEELEESKKTLIFPKNKKLLNLTVWLAIEDATLENGCLYFANGSHNYRFKEVKSSPSKGAFSFLNHEKISWQQQKSYSKVFDFNEQEWNIEAVPAKAGQIIILTEKVMHGSPANHSSQPRIGINARYINPSVQIYPHRKQGDYIDGVGNNIERHFSILVSGSDDYKLNVVQANHTNPNR
jgi:chlorinating enzyme